MMLCPKDLITIAAKDGEGNAGGGAACCFDEDGPPDVMRHSSKMGTRRRGGTPPAKSEECASGCGSMSCRQGNFGNVQVIEREGLAGEKV